MLFPEQEEVALLFDKISFAWASGGNAGGASSQNKSEIENCGPLDPRFEPPMESELEQMALDVAKDAAKGVSGEIASALKGGEGKTEPPK